MSTATATEAPVAPAAKGKKKLIIIMAAACLALAVVGGGGAWLLLKKKASEADAEGEDATATHVAAKKEAHGVPVFVPLDPFTVNLADRDAERYAQIGITLEIEDTKTGDQIKAYMPAIRNNILMAIADHSAGDLLGREGKAELADRIKRETARALGFSVDEQAPAADDGKAERKPTKRPRKGDTPLPVKAVHFSTFIIQ